MVARRWRRLLGVRIRTTAVASLVVATALVLGGALLVVEQRRSLTGDIATAARLRAQDVAGTLAAGTVPNQINAPGDDQSLAQIVDVSTGRVVAASGNIAGEPRISRVVPPRGSFVFRNVGSVPVGDSSYVVVAHAVRSPAGNFVVYAATSLKPVTQSSKALVRLLAAGLPGLLALVAGMTWIVTGWALRPVEHIRSDVAEISERDLHRRVPEPGTGDEIDGLARTMNAMLARIDDASARQRRFVADASHELRSPLTAIRSQLEVDLAHPQRADWQSTDREVLDETTRLQRLVADLLVLAQRDTGELPMRRRRVDLDDLVLDEVRQLRAHGRVAVDLTGLSGGQVSGDADQLRRAVRNLLDNAERHAATGVRVELRETDTQVELAVIDDGPGIPSDQRAVVFERFSRLDDGRTRDAGGTGLGLAITREIVAAHGGTVTLAPSGRPTTFLVTLPSAARGTPADP